MYFVEWLEFVYFKGICIYYFGIGGYYYVGIECVWLYLNNIVFGVMVLLKEYKLYVDFVMW